MTLFEIFISVLFTVAFTVIGWLIWRTLKSIASNLKTTQTQLENTKSVHGEKLQEHDKEIQRHTLELEHSKEISMRTEREVKHLLEQNNEKFDQLIDLFARSLNVKKQK